MKALMPNTVIIHLTSYTDLQTAKIRGEYTAPSLETEGFIHCSRADQILKVAETFYGGERGLVLLVIDPTKLTAALKWEPPAGGPPHGVSESDLFPHVYGPINLDAVLEVLDFPVGADGHFALPDKLQ
jgi:uncharacterized protein (DUF952 family)